MQFIVIIIAGFFYYYFLKRNLFDRNINFIVSILFILVMLDFFGGFHTGNKAILFFTIPFIILNYKNKSMFSKLIFIYLAGLFLSMLSSYYFRQQTIQESFWVYQSLYGILFYFIIKSFNLSIKDMEKIIIIIVSFFLVAYIVQYLVYPKLIFINEDQEYVGDIRIRMTGQALVSLGYFFCLNKQLANNKFNILYSVIIILCLLVIFLMGFRTMLLGIVVVTSIAYIKIIGFSYKLLVYSLIAIFGVVLLLQTPVVSEKIESMIERQQTDNFSNNDYIRLIQYQYYTKEHFKSIGEYVLGSGLPQRGNSSSGIKASAYGTYMDGLVSSGLNWVDWGLLSMSWVIGIIPILVIIFYSIKIFRLRVSKQYEYIGLWFLYLLVISFTTLEQLRPGSLTIQAFCFVLIEQIYNRQVKFDWISKHRTTLLRKR